MNPHPIVPILASKDVIDCKFLTANECQRFGCFTHSYFRTRNGDLLHPGTSAIVHPSTVFDPSFETNARRIEERIFRKQVPDSVHQTVERIIPLQRSNFTSGDSRPKWVSVCRAYLPAIENMRPELVLSRFYDITESLNHTDKHHSKSLLRHYRQLYQMREFPRSSPVIFEYSHDLEGRLLSLSDPNNFFNLQVKEFAYSAFDMLGDVFARGLARHVGSQFVQATIFPNNCFQTRGFNGELVFVECQLERKRNAFGKGIIYGKCRLLSDVVNETLSRYARVMSGGKVAGWDRNLETGEFQVSMEWKRFLGISEDEQVSFDDFLSRIHLEDLPIAKAAIKENENGGSYDVEYRIRTDQKNGNQDNRWVWHRAVGKKFSDATGKSLVSGVNFDIDLEKQLNVLLRKIVDADPHLIFIKDKEGRFVFANKALADFYGLQNSSDAEGKNDDWFYQGDERLSIRTQLQGFRNADQATLTSDRDLPCFYEYIIPPHGEPDAAKWLATVKRKIHYRGSEHVLGISTDISTVAFEKETLDDLVRNSPAVMFVKNQDGTYKKVNKAFLELVNARSHQDVLGKKAEDFFFPESAEQIAHYDNHVLASGSLRMYEHEVVLKDGTSRRLRGSKVRRSFVDENGQHAFQLLGIYYDAQGGKTFENYSMLQAILTCLEHDYAKTFLGHVLTQLSSRKPLCDFEEQRGRWTLMLEMSSKYLSRLRWLGKSDLPLATSPSLSHLEGRSVTELVCEVDQMLNSCGIPDPPIRIESDSLASSVKVKANQEVFCTVLLNFIVNARNFTVAVRDSFGQELALNELRSREIIVRIREQNNHLLIEVDDHGIGLPPEAKSNFDQLYQPGIRFVPRLVAMKSSGNGLYFAKRLVEVILLGSVRTPTGSKRGGASFMFSAKIET